MKGETEDKSSANVEIGLHQLDWHTSQHSDSAPLADVGLQNTAETPTGFGRAWYNSVLLNAFIPTSYQPPMPSHRNVAAVKFASQEPNCQTCQSTSEI